MGSMATTCEKDEPCPGCYQANFKMASTPTTERLDSIYYLDERQAVWPDLYEYGDTLFLDLAINPILENSTFYFFYENAPSDTLIISHYFEESYSDFCQDYYLELMEIDVDFHTFKTITKTKENKCFRFAISL